MNEIEIINTIIEPLNDGWYHITIELNIGKNLDFYIKERLEIKNYDPTQATTFSIGTTTDTVYDSTTP